MGNMKGLSRKMGYNYIYRPFCKRIFTQRSKRVSSTTLRFKSRLPLCPSDWPAITLVLHNEDDTNA